MAVCTLVAWGVVHAGCVVHAGSVVYAETFSPTGSCWTSGNARDRIVRGSVHRPFTGVGRVRADVPQTFVTSGALVTHGVGHASA